MPASGQERVRLPPLDAVAAAPRTVFSVGAAEGAEWEMFGAVGDVAFDAAGNLYVLDRLNARVVAFDGRGRFVRTIGRRGGGPGEFTAPQQMAVTAAGEVIVSDVGRRAFSVFGTGGNLIRTVPFGGGSLPVGRRLVAHPRGGVVSRAMGNPAGRGPTALGDEVLLWYPRDGGTPRPLQEISLARDRLPAGGGSIASSSRPVFSPSFHFAVLPDGGIAIVDSAGYSIRITGADGQVMRVISRPIAPRRVTARDRAAERDRRAREVSGDGGVAIVGARPGAMTPQVRRSVAEGLQDVRFAAVMPVIAGVSVDRAGNLWVQRSGAVAGQGGPIDVLTPSGRYLRTYTGFPLPTAFGPGGRAAYVVMDDLGFQRVVVVRLAA